MKNGERGEGGLVHEVEGEEGGGGGGAEGDDEDDKFEEISDFLMAWQVSFVCVCMGMGGEGMHLV
jgi:hypothetical protein